MMRLTYEEELFTVVQTTFEKYHSGQILVPCLVLVGDLLEI